MGLLIFQIPIVMDLPAQDAQNTMSVIVKDASGWSISVAPDGSAVIFRSDDLDRSAALPAGTYSFVKLSRAIVLDRNRTHEPNERRYTASFQTGACEVRYDWTEQQDICAGIFRTAIRELATVPSKPAGVIRGELMKNREHL